MEFQVFRHGSAVDNFTLCGAYLFGTDGMAIRRAQVSLRDGVIVCEKTNLETAGLALLWPVEGFGKVLLPTTCLPERDGRYVLNVEIARAKLMHVINKQEDWGIFDGMEGLEDLSKEARGLLIEAIQNIGEPPAASKFADKSLQKATVLSEKLAMMQAQSLFEARGKNHGFSRGCLGCRVDPGQITNAGYIEKLVELFGFVTVPVNWAAIESSRGTYDFSSVDACINALCKKKLAICGGPLLCFSDAYLPKWLLHSGAGFEKVRETAYRFVARMVARYAGIVHAWRVISGLNALNHFGFSFEQILEMTRAANLAVRAVSNRAVKIVEVSNPWGEYYATTPNTIPPLVYMDMVVQSGINFDAFGLQMRFGKNESGMHVRDMMQISSILDYFGAAAKPLYITEVEVPSENGTGLYEPEVAGMWHQEWDQARQGHWIEQFYKIALSKPFVETVTYSNLTDTTDSAIASSGLLTARLEPKESFRTLKKLQKLIFGR
ncbi:MAG TPA: endo-1,4-beta-xylanase [Sedimentisphaerales bacterium]|nr:endo-1,4-beta-xylanase [Sedimentisphaerales bacterium]